MRDPNQGPLPILLLVLTMMSGVVDAVSILGFGRVFVANMTGNVAFSAFAIAGAPGFSLAVSVAALLGFLGGAFLGGLRVSKYAANRGFLLRDTCTFEFAFLAAAFFVVLPGPHKPGLGVQLAAAALVAAAMGMQNAAARKLAVPDLTTTVLTMTLTGLAADIVHGTALVMSRRLLAVFALFLGAAIGAMLVLHTQLIYGLALAMILSVTVALAAFFTSRRSDSWQTYKI